MPSPSPLLLSVGFFAAASAFQTTTVAFVHDVASCRKSHRTRQQQNNAAGVETPVVASSISSSSLLLTNTNNDQKAEDSNDPDLFDYFDPLLSPHAYPSGISPESKPSAQNNDEAQKQKDGDEASSSKGRFGFRLSNDEPELKSPPPSPSSSSSSNKGDFGFKIRPNPPGDSPTIEDKDDNSSEEDLFDYFDPLRSPHEYPDGIGSKKGSMPSAETTPALEIDEDSSKSAASSGGKKKKVGVLLMDHGSKKEKSNARLQAMAKLYQMTMFTDEDEEDDATPTVVVRASHMEIAEPSIYDGLKDLKENGVDEIVCHPFFLSANGRHVKEDIPQLIGEAVEELWGENSGAAPIPVVTTAPVGSNTQLMLGAIHSLVRENSQYLKSSLLND
mmetsp:Transcript_107243/g.218857  ORF Transcript_107243/g.218857 Transcript_107243/m.218857 type:complete len:388 (-) Transcript_107243:38-1201(-)